MVEVELSRRRFIRHALMAAAGSSVVLAALARPSQVAASGTIHDGVSMVGDSLTSGSLLYQADDFAAVGWPDAWIDAHASRGIRTHVSADPHTGLTAVDALRARHGDTRMWVVALGTNDAGIFAAPRYDELIGAMLDRIGSGHVVTWVNIYLPHATARQTAWNSALDAVAAARPDELRIFDWARLAAQHPAWLARDNIHCNPTGYRERSTAIAAGVASGMPAGTNDLPSTQVVTHVKRF